MVEFLVSDSVLFSCGTILSMQALRGATMGSSIEQIVTAMSFHISGMELKLTLIIMINAI